MSSNTRIMSTTPDRVWDVLADGWLFPLWVVGASRIREVDGTWPAVGSRIHHSVGVWPLLIDDNTEVTACEPGRVLAVRARVWPAGSADVTLRLTALGSNTEVVMEEDISAGPARLVPKPLRTPLLAWRNVESLRRLAFIAERRAS